MVVACVAIIVVGPKDLPKMLRTFGKAIGNIRRMAGDFQKQFDDVLREAELDELKDVASPAKFSPLEDAKNSINEIRESMNNSIAPDEKPDAKPVQKKKPAKKAPARKTPAKKKTAGKPAKTAAGKPARSRAAAKPRKAAS